ncbi:hypothetical protein M2321_002437 [Rhodoblastus acidophilus]|nr:hypothetical protein [Rhodoblastus acidophilus]
MLGNGDALDRHEFRNNRLRKDTPPQLTWIKLQDDRIVLTLKIDCYFEVAFREALH